MKLSNLFVLVPGSHCVRNVDRDNHVVKKVSEVAQSDIDLHNQILIYIIRY